MLDFGLGLGFNYSALSAAISRYITSLSAAGGMYYQLSEPLVIGAGEDFEIEVPFATSSSDIQMLLGTDSSTSCIFINSADNWLTVRDLNNVSKQTGFNAFEDAAVCILSIKRVSNILTISTPNGTWTDSSVTGGFEFKYVGQRGSGGTYNFTGEIYDLKIWTGGDRNTGTLVLDMPIDEDWTRGTVVHNRAAVLGDELVVNGTFESGTDAWSPNNSTLTVDENGRLVVTGTVASSNTAYQGIPTTIGATYLLEFDFIKGTAPNVQQVRVGSTPQGLNVLQKTIPLSKTYAFLFTAISTTTYLNFGYGETEVGQTSIWDNISVREIPTGYPFATAINVTESEAEKFTKVDGGTNWLGEEFLTNGYFDTDSDWVKGTGWSISGGQAIQSGAPTSELLYQNVSRPAVYRIAVDVESISVDGIRFYDGAAYAYAVGQAGSYSFDVINKNTNYNFITIRSDVNTIANINSVSAKRIIPIAQGGA